MVYLVTLGTAPEPSARELPIDYDLDSGSTVFVYVPGRGLLSTWRIGKGRLRGGIRLYSAELVQVFDPPLKAHAVTSAVESHTFDLSSFRGGKAFELSLDDETRLLAALQGSRAPNAEFCLFSTSFSGPGVRELNPDAIRRELVHADKIVLLSAYFEPDQLALLLSDLPGAKRCSLTLVFDAREVERRRAADSKTYDSVLAALDENFRTFEALVCRQPGGIFHTKLFHVERQGKWTSLVGSANLTDNALGGSAKRALNEEFLVKLVGQQALDTRRYVDAVLQHAAKIEASRARGASSVSDLLLDARLYFRPTNPLTLTYNPFTEFLGKVPAAERLLLNISTPLTDAEPGNGLTAFSLEEALRKLSKLETATDEKSRATVKPLAVETCYGLWVPTPSVTQFEETLKGPSAKRRRHLVDLSKALAPELDCALLAISPELMARFSAYLKDARELADSRKFNRAEHLRRIREKTPRAVDPFTDTTGFVKFVKSLAKRLGNPAEVERRSRTFVGGPMPDLRADSDVAIEFKVSFFEYIAFSLQQPKRPSVVTAIAAFAGLERRDTVEDLERKLELKLHATPWTDVEWKRRQSAKVDVQ
jgi:hypothetical protein